MDTVILIILLIANLVMARRLGQLQPPKPVKELVDAPRTHRLLRTWVEPDPGDGGWPGWRFKCSCGTQGMATNCKQGVLGSESNAVKQFTDHAALFASVNEESWKHRHDLVRDQFAWYVERCYCKQTNDDLAAWRDQ